MTPTARASNFKKRLLRLCKMALYLEVRMFGRYCNRYTRRQAKKSWNVLFLLISLRLGLTDWGNQSFVIKSFIIVLIISVMKLCRIKNVLRQMYGGCATDDDVSARSFVTWKFQKKVKFNTHSTPPPHPNMKVIGKRKFQD